MTFALLGASDTKRRKNGTISFVNARLLVDGPERVVNLRSKVGQPVLLRSLRGSLAR